MNNKYYHIVGQLKSWESGYISPSAQIAIKDAREFIESQAEEINKLREELAKLKSKPVQDVEF